MNQTSDASSKIKPLEDLAALFVELKAQGQTIVHCHGVFDLVHPGHIRHLEAAKAKGSILVVTITRDEFVNKGPGRPVFNERLRAESLAALQVVDYVGINEWPTAVETIQLLKPDIYVKGNDYSDSGKDVTGNISLEEQAVNEGGGSIHFTNEIVFSSTKLLNSYFSVLSPDVESYLNDLRKRFSADDVIERLRTFKDLKVLVVGDTIIDEYHFCTPLGMATKSNVINARYLGEEAHAGGVLCVANSMAGFCGDVTLLSCLGEEESREEFIRSRLQPNIKAKFWHRPNAPTTIKRRFIEPHRYNKLMGICFIEDSPLEDEIATEIEDYLKRKAHEYDLVVVADFGHGMLTPTLVQTLCDTAPHLVVSAQTNSINFGYNLITKYPRVDHVVIDEPELRLASHDRNGELEKMMAQLAETMQASNLSITRGQHGSATWLREHGFTYAPAFTSQALDATGAGDAYLSLAALCGVKGYPPEIISFVGNCAGAMAVRTLGNRESIQAISLYKFITTLLK